MTISAETTNMTDGVEEMVRALGAISGVLKAEILAG